MTCPGTPRLKLPPPCAAPELAAKGRERIPNVSWLLFDANAPDPDKALGVIKGYDWVINAIGITKPLVHDDNAFEVERATKVNSLLPHQLARKAEANRRQGDTDSYRLRLLGEKRELYGEATSTTRWMSTARPRAWVR